MVQIDFSGCSPKLEAEFLKGRHFKDVQAALSAVRNQERLNAITHRQQTRAVAGLGAPTAHLDPVVAEFWRRREGRRVWEDPGHWRYFHRHGLIQKGKPAGEKAGSMIGWTPGSNSLAGAGPKSDGRKFHKSYG